MAIDPAAADEVAPDPEAQMQTKTIDSDHVMIGVLIGAIISVTICLCLVCAIAALYFFRGKAAIRERESVAYQDKTVSIVAGAHSELFESENEGTTAGQPSTGNQGGKELMNTLPDMSFTSQKKGSVVLVDEGDSDGVVIYAEDDDGDQEALLQNSDNEMGNETGNETGAGLLDDDEDVLPQDSDDDEGQKMLE